MPEQKSKLLAEKLQCPTTTSKSMIQCLRKQPIEKLVDQMVTWFKPAVEKGNPNAFLPENPYKLLKDKKVYDLPWVTSNVFNESLFSLECELRILTTGFFVSGFGNYVVQSRN